MKFQESEFDHLGIIEDSSKEDEIPLIYKFIIHSDSKWKPIFDLFMLLIVCYSCIFNVLVVSFESDTFQSFDTPNRCIEVFFYIDIILSFFQAYKHP